MGITKITTNNDLTKTNSLVPSCTPEAQKLLDSFEVTVKNDVLTSKRKNYSTDLEARTFFGHNTESITLNGQQFNSKSVVCLYPWSLQKNFFLKIFVLPSGQLLRDTEIEHSKIKLEMQELGFWEEENKTVKKKTQQEIGSTFDEEGSFEETSITQYIESDESEGIVARKKIYTNELKNLLLQFKRKNIDLKMYHNFVDDDDIMAGRNGNTYFSFDGISLPNQDLGQFPYELDFSKEQHIKEEKLIYKFLKKRSDDNNILGE